MSNNPAQQPTQHPAELDWPFFDDSHRDFKSRLDVWCNEHLAHAHHDESRDAVDAECIRLVRLLGSGGWLKHAVSGTAYGAASDVIDTRQLCLLRETLAFHNGLSDFAFAMQGLGTGAISLMGSPDQKQRYLPRVASGQALSAFALSEPEAGSDVAAMQCGATATADGYVLNGRKTWISNGGIADFYVVFARTGEAPGEGSNGTPGRGAKGITAFIVDADTPGLTIDERIDVIAPHPLATLKFDHCKVAAAQRIGDAGQGFKVAMATLDVFRTSVAAAALGFGRRALHESIVWARSRRMFGQSLGDFQITQVKIAQMATMLDAATLLTYRAAWLRDQGARITREAAMAKMTATENAQQIIDMAVQMHGGMGVKKGVMVESLYREIRALRIYEGATEVQQLIIGKDLLKG
jgi:acyl-CoA dehydrogenase